MKHSLFYKCLVFSVGLHFAALWVFYLQPVFLQPKASNLFGKAGPAEVIPLAEEDINLSEKNIALEEVFNQIIVVSPSIYRPYDFEQIVAPEEKQPVFEDKPAKIISDLEIPEGTIVEEALLPTPTLSLPTDLLEAVLATEARVSPILPQLEMDKSPSPDIILELQHTAALTPEKDPSANVLPLLGIHYPPAQESQSVKKIEPKGGIDLQPLAVAAPDAIALVSPEELLQKAPSFSHHPQASVFLGTPPKGFPKSRARTDIPSLDYYALPQGSTPVEWNEEFDVEVCSIEKKEDGKSVFSLSFKPKFDMRKQSMKQNFYFLVDRSNSIERHRFQTFKRAVAKAVRSLRDGDSFNIILFDTRVARLSENPIPFSQQAVEAADEFLDKQRHQNLFTATDIYECLNKLFPPTLNEDEMHTAIFISDGDSIAAAEKQRTQINTWLEKNDSRVHLFTAAVGQGNNLAVLDLLSHASRGQMLYSDTHAAFPRKLAKLVIDLRFPLGREMAASVLKGSPDICLFPSSPHLPALYSDKPFTVYGVADKLSDFTILLQGRHKDQWLSIKKNISFAKVKTNSRALEKEWVNQKAYSLYEKFLKEGQISQLEQAQSLLPTRR